MHLFIYLLSTSSCSLGCRQDCKSVPTKQCRTVPQQKCHPVSSKVCLNIPNQKCDVLPAEKCLTIPVLTTSNVCQVTTHHLQRLSGDSSPPPTFVRWFLTTSNNCQVTPHHLQQLSGDSSTPPTFVRWLLTTSNVCQVRVNKPFLAHHRRPPVISYRGHWNLDPRITQTDRVCPYAK